MGAKDTLTTGPTICSLSSLPVTSLTNLTNLTNMTKQVLTPDCRLHFPALLTPRPVAKDKPDEKKFQATLLLPPGTDMAPFVAAVKFAYREKFGADLTGQLRNPPIRKTGELASLQSAVESPDWWFLRASSKFAPAVRDRANQPVTDEKLIYAGLYVRAYVSAYAWMHPQQGKGVSWNLDGVQILKAGEPFKAVSNVSFEALEPLAMDKPASNAGAAGNVAGLWD